MNVKECREIYREAFNDPDTAFENLPEDWVCPLCSVGKDEFEVVEE